MLPGGSRTVRRATARNDTGQIYVLAAGPRFLANVQVGMGLEDIDIFGVYYPVHRGTREYRPPRSLRPIGIIAGS